MAAVYLAGALYYLILFALFLFITNSGLVLKWLLHLHGIKQITAVAAMFTIGSALVFAPFFVVEVV